MSSIFDDPVDAQKEPMLMVVRRGFPKAQELLANATIRTVAVAATVSWFGADFYPETAPSLALVQDGGPYEDLVGEVVKVTRIWPAGVVSVYAFVDAAVTLEPDSDIALARRAFLSLALLSTEALTAKVEVVA